MNIELTGTLVVSKNNWGMLKVPQALADGVFKALNIPGIQQPEGSAHISVFTDDEVESLGGAAAIKERGRDFKYKLGKITTVNPAGWPEMSRVWFIECSSPELSRLRQGYGLTPKLHVSHPFHITVAVKPVNVKEAEAADDEDIEKNKRRSWFSRHKRLIGGLLATGVGAAALVALVRHKNKGTVNTAKPGVTTAEPEAMNTIQAPQASQAPASPADAVLSGIPTKDIPVLEDASTSVLNNIPTQDIPVLDTAKPPPADVPEMPQIVRKPVAEPDLSELMRQGGAVETKLLAKIKDYKAGGDDPSPVISTLLPHLSDSQQTVIRATYGLARKARDATDATAYQAGMPLPERMKQTATGTAAVTPFIHVLNNLGTPKNILSPKHIANTAIQTAPGYFAYESITGKPMDDLKSSISKQLADSEHLTGLAGYTNTLDLPAFLTFGAQPVSQFGHGLMSSIGKSSVPPTMQADPLKFRSLKNVQRMPATAKTLMGSGLANMYLTRQLLGAAGSFNEFYRDRPGYMADSSKLLTDMGRMNYPRKVWEAIANPKVWGAIASAPAEMGKTRAALNRTRQELELLNR